METKTFYYSKYRPWFMTIVFSGIEIFLLYALINLLIGKLFIGVGAFFVLLIFNAVGIFFTIKKYLLPAINNDVALELDEEKIQYNINNWELNWNEIDNISSTLYGVKLTLKNGDDIYISFRYLRGNWDLIRDAVNEHFENQ